MNRISSAIKNIIPRGAVVVTGVSGGPDSLCMLHALVNAGKDLNLVIVPVHINHKFRDAADSEQRHIEEICKEMGLECNSFVVDCPSMAKERKLTEEEAGRIARYDAFDRVAARLSVEYPSAQVVIAVAHNADDQSETVIHRIMRGTGLKGLAGMSNVSTDEGGWTVVRPLLGITRAEIERYVEDNRLEPNMDESNEATDYTRNRIRLELLPYIEEHFNPGISRTLRSLADIAAVDEDYMRQAAEAAYQEVVAIKYDMESDAEGESCFGAKVCSVAGCEADAESNSAKKQLILDVVKACNLHSAIQRRVIGMMLSNIGMDSEISYSLITGVLDVLNSDNPSAMINLPGGFTGMREYGKLILARTESAEETCLDAMILRTSVVDASDWQKPEGGIYAVFDYDKFCDSHPTGMGDIVLRTRRAGDVIAIKGGGHKKIQNYFVDNKVPARYRDMIPIVAAGAEILWIPSSDVQNGNGDRIKAKYSHNYQTDDGTERVLFLEITKKIW